MRNVLAPFGLRMYAEPGISEPSSGTRGAGVDLGVHFLLPSPSMLKNHADTVAWSYQAQI
ncbi:hypothetical protein RSAG8_07673, partial [Rhizoctonia solani AG-8 WAC10335]